MTALNAIELREWAYDSDKANNNFVIASSYRGRIDAIKLQACLKQLTEIHPRLKLTLKVIDQVPRFFPLENVEIPLTQFDKTDADQWKTVVKQELKKRFKSEHKVLWRVIFLKEGNLIFTFQHALTDAIGAIEMIKQLYMMLSNQSPSITLDFHFPELETLFRSEGPLSLENSVPLTTPRYSTRFGILSLSRGLTEKIHHWGQKHHVRMNSILLAAFALAMVRVRKLSYEKLELLSAVNYRPFFQPAVSKAVLRPISTCLVGNFKVGEATPFVDLAQSIHADLYARLKAGEHTLELQKLFKKVASHPGHPEIMLEGMSPKNMLCITNAGDVSNDKRSADLELTKLVFVANCNHYYEHKDNATLCALTFRGELNLTLLTLEELVTEEESKRILNEIENILSNL